MRRRLGVALGGVFSQDVSKCSAFRGFVNVAKPDAKDLMSTKASRDHAMQA